MNILDVFFPKRCLGCGKIGRYFCSSCCASATLIDTPICPVCEKPAIDGTTHPRCQTRFTVDGLTSVFRYDGVARQAIKALKYRFVSDLAKEFVDLIPQKILNELTKLRTNELTLVPIPLHPSKRRYRGFNQAEALGTYLARRLNIPIHADILRRTKQTVPQVHMSDRTKRLKNMEGAFTAQRTMNDESKAIVLFDDVFTTGATMRAAANVLKRSGAKRVWAVTMAR